MHRSFAWLDDALIELLFQPWCDAATQRLGLGRAATASICIDVAAVAWIASRGWGLSVALAAWDVTSAVSGLLLLLVGLAAMLSLRVLFQRAGNARANPLRPIMRPHRAVLLLMLLARLVQLSGFGLSGAGDLVMLLSASAALYVAACAGQPPLRRKFALDFSRGPRAV